MILARSSEILKIEERALKECGLTEELLMENAGAQAAKEIWVRYFPEIKKGPTVIVCGTGNNGADGLVVARHLTTFGARKIHVMLTGPLESSKPMVKKQWNRLPPSVWIENGPEILKRAHLVVDAIFGMGFKVGRKTASSWIEALNQSPAKVVSLDLPSGVEADTGKSAGAVRADLTLSFIGAKLGLLTSRGASQSGDLRVLPIGIPKSLVAKEARTVRLFSSRLAKRLLPNRGLSANKTSFGQTVVCAGRPGFWGAGILSSHAAFRVGSGYVTWACESELPGAQDLFENPAVLTKTWDQIDEIKKPTAFVIGPGAGTGEETKALLKKLLTQKAPVVADADALTVLAENPELHPAENWILTPHTGELSRLLGVSSEDIDGDRFRYVLEASQKFRCAVLLKGFRSLLAKQNRIWVIESGNPALAKAGTGDVLSGMIGGLLSQKLSPLSAAALGAFLHGRVADDWIYEGQDVSSLIATDLVSRLPQTLKFLRGES